MFVWPLTIQWLWKQRHKDKKIRQKSENVNVGAVQVKGIREVFVLTNFSTSLKLHQTPKSKKEGKNPPCLKKKPHDP